MPIEAIITDVTRMRSPNVCIAAAFEDRPIRLDNPQPRDGFVQALGGLTPGDVVSVDWKPTEGSTPPHIEDGEWVSSSLKKLRRLTEPELATYLSNRAFNSIQDAFGVPSIRGTGGNAAFSPNSGTRSLASILARSVRVYLDFNRIRVDFADSLDSWTRVPLEDLTVRRHQSECSICQSRLADVLQELCGDAAVLRIGLARPFQTPQYPLLCWMQVNHIFVLPPKRDHLLSPPVRRRLRLPNPFSLLAAARRRP